MKTVKQVVAVVLWCAVSVGCVAEEVKQPASAETPAAPAEADVQEKSKSSGKDEITITTRVDSKTGEKYQELSAILKIEKINQMKIGEHYSIFAINNIAILVPDRIRIPYPNDFEYLSVNTANWPSLHGKTASLTCRSSKKFRETDFFCSYKKPPYLCSNKGDVNFSFDYYCSIEDGSHTINF